MSRSQTVVRGARRWPVFTIIAAILIAIGAMLVNQVAPLEVARLLGISVRTSGPGTTGQPAPVNADSRVGESTASQRVENAEPAQSGPDPGEPSPTSDAVSTTTPPLERLQAAASSGDPPAQYTLGVALLEGKHAPADRPRALAWFMQSAARGNARAVDARDRLFASMDDGERVRAESLSRSLESPMPAGWIDANGVRVWAPSWYRNGTWDISINVKEDNGLAQGHGSVQLDARLYGRSSRGYEGTFVDGLLLDESLNGWKLDLLETDAYRVHIPVRGEDTGSLHAIWLQNRMQGLNITACPRHGPELYAVLTSDFPVLDDGAVISTAKKVAQTTATLCPLDPRGGVNSSAGNGHRLLALGYEQRLRDGPSLDALRAQLRERFGEPDNETGSGTWLTWWLTSETGEPRGAFLRARIQADRASGRVSLLRLILTDSDLMRKDERQAHAARQAEKRRKDDESRSDQVKF